MFPKDAMKPKKKPTAAAAPASQPPLPAERRIFTEEFKLAAVERMQQGDISVLALALELGLQRSQLYKWEEILGKRIPGEPIRRRGRLPAAEESEVVRLRRELARANEELAILKKFDAYLTQLKK